MNDWLASVAALLAIALSGCSLLLARLYRRRAERHAVQAAACAARARRLLAEAYPDDIDEGLRTDLQCLLGALDRATAYACPRCPRAHHPGRPCPDTCDASAPGAYGTLTGPCILRRDHDGPVHRDADGCRWQATNPAADDGPIPYSLTDTTGDRS